MVACAICRATRITSYNVCYTKLLRVAVPILWVRRNINHGFIESFPRSVRWIGYGHSYSLRTGCLSSVILFVNFRCIIADIQQYIFFAHSVYRRVVNRMRIPISGSSSFQYCSEYFVRSFGVVGNGIRITSYNVCYTKLLRDKKSTQKRPEGNFRFCGGAYLHWASLV